MHHDGVVRRQTKHEPRQARPAAGAVQHACFTICASLPLISAHQSGVQVSLLLKPCLRAQELQDAEEGMQLVVDTLHWAGPTSLLASCSLWLNGVQQVSPGPKAEALCPS